MFALGIDCGTTYSAAAVRRAGRAEICTLGTHAAVVPSVVLLREDGGALVGEAAARRALVEPDRVAREFKRRLGDSTPLVLGGSPVTAEELTAHLLAALVGAVRDREGEAPSHITLCHPATWGRFKTDVLRRAVDLAGLGVPVGFLTEPEAAAVDYAHRQRLAPGQTVAVYDLGGGTFDAAVLRRTDEGFAILGQPEGIERLGGVDIDAAVFAHVARAVGAPLTGLDEDDAAAVAAVARLRAECVAAKEALSTDTDTAIPVLLPDWTGEVRLTRAELEDVIRPSLYDSIAALKRALRSAGVVPDDLTAVLLVGGSSRIPLVGQLVGAELGRPVAVDTHPKHAVALGAAWHAGDAAGLPSGGGAGPSPLVQASPVPPPAAPAAPADPAPAVAAAPALPPAALAPVPRPPLPLPPAPSVATPPAPSPAWAPAPAPAVLHGGVRILRPAGPGPRPAPPTPPTPAYAPPPAPPFTPARQRDDDRRRGAALFGAAVGTEAGVAGVIGYEQGRAPAPHPAAPAAPRPAPRPPARRPWLDLRDPWAVASLAAIVTALSVLAVYLAVWPRDTAAVAEGPPTAVAGVSTSVTGQGADAAGRRAGEAVAPPASGAATGQQQAPAGPAAGAAGAGGAGTVLVGIGYQDRHTGVVRSSDGRIACPGTCSASYPRGTAVTLTAAGEPVDHWSGCAAASGSTCRLTAGDGQAPTVSYVVRYRVGIGYSGRHTGTITSDDGAIRCPGSCSASYPRGTAVTLRVSGERVERWTGCSKVMGDVCQVTAGDGSAPTVVFAAATQPTTQPPARTSTSSTTAPSTTAGRSSSSTTRNAGGAPGTTTGTSTGGSGGSGSGSGKATTTTATAGRGGTSSAPPSAG